MCPLPWPSSPKTPSSSSGLRRSGPPAAPHAAPRGGGRCLQRPPSSRAGRYRAKLPEAARAPATGERGGEGRGEEGAPGEGGRQQPRPEARAARLGFPPGSAHLQLRWEQGEGRESGDQGRACPGDRPRGQSLTGQGRDGQGRDGTGRDGTGRAGKASPVQGIPAQPHPAPTAPHLSPGPGQTPPEAKPGASPSPTLQTCSGPSWGGLAEVALP